MARYTIAALALLAALSACEETPSYELRWELASRADPTKGEAITRAFQCSQLGITAVAATAFDELGAIVDVEIFPCFPEDFDDPEGRVAGPELRAGTYALEVRAVQRDLEPWTDPLVELPQTNPRCVPGADPFGCGLEDVACACEELDVVSNQTNTDLDEILLTPAPGECVDGIDNDLDGFVDGGDPGCSPREGSCDDADCVAVEGGDVAVVQLRLLATILDVNPVATCGDPLTSFRIVARGQSGDPITLATTECRINGLLFFARELADDGPFTIEVTGLDAEGQTRTKPVVGASMVEASTQAVVDLRVDFGEDDFDPPLVAATKVSVGYESAISSDRGCLPTTYEGKLRLATSTMTLVDLDGVPVSSFPPLDGEPTLCKYGDYSTPELPWGGYRLIAEARAADGTVCFATAPEGAPLAPGSVQFVVPRVLVDGRPPDACVDCETAEDCEGLECRSGICR